MVARTNSAEGGTNGTGVTTGNSGGASGTAWELVNLGTGGAIAFSNVTPKEGSLCYLCTPASSQQQFLRWTEAAADSAMLSVYIRFATLPGATSYYLALRSTSAQTCQMTISSTGRVAVQDAASTVLSTSAVGEVITIDTWYRLELRGVKGTTSSNGTIQAAFYLGDSTTAIWSYSSATVDAGTAQIVNTRIGRSSSGVADTTPYRLDALQFWTGTDTPAALGRPWSLAKITGIAATRISSSSLSLAWTDVADAPDGYDVVYCAGTHTNDGLGRTPSDPLYDPLTISGAVVVSTGDAGTPFVQTGLTPSDGTWWLIRSAP
jgi:hypothetical protein